MTHDAVREAAERVLQGELVEKGENYEIHRGPSPDVKLLAELVAAELKPAPNNRGGRE